MKDGRCKKLTLSYPKHRFSPVDLLHFIESVEFTEACIEIGISEEHDLTSIQLCIMADPEGDREVPNTGGLREHVHGFSDWSCEEQVVTVYYMYFEEYGIVYLDWIRLGDDEMEFSEDECQDIRESISSVLRELERVRTID